MIIEVTSESEMKTLGAALGGLLVGGEVIELVGDVGAGKTTFTKGLALGLGVDETVQSPSFTISRVYTTGSDLLLAHYDFYRLHDAGIMADELQETISDPRTITVVEWAGIIEGVLPEQRLTVSITSPSETVRRVEVIGDSVVVERMMEQRA
jgi:tRNA threonylcarbamoyladenosine biosynthesis protein TsaE